MFDFIQGLILFGLVILIAFGVGCVVYLIGWGIRWAWFKLGGRA